MFSHSSSRTTQLTQLISRKLNPHHSSHTIRHTPHFTPIIPHNSIHSTHIQLTQTHLTFFSPRFISRNSSHAIGRTNSSHIHHVTQPITHDSIHSTHLTQFKSHKTHPASLISVNPPSLNSHPTFSHSAETHLTHLMLHNSSPSIRLTQLTSHNSTHRTYIPPLKSFNGSHSTHFTPVPLNLKQATPITDARAVVEGETHGAALSYSFAPTLAPSSVLHFMSHSSFHRPTIIHISSYKWSLRS